MTRRRTRRSFLALSGSTAAAVLAPGAATAARGLARRLEGGGAAVAGFRSRHDLSPAAVTVSTGAPASEAGYVFVASATGPGQRGPMILDERGGLVWFRPLTDATAMNFEAQRYRGEPVLTWWQGGITGGYGVGEYVIADSAYRDLHRVRAGNGYQGDLHEFLLTDRGSALLTAYRPLPADLTAFGGPAAGTLLESVVQEVDVASGRVLFEWHAGDHVSLDESYAAPADGVFDWFHVNSVDVDADGDLLVSARNTWAIYKLDRSSGEVIWRLGGKRSDFALGPGAAFYWQHDARRQPDGTISVFDDGAAPAEEPASRGIRLVVDESARTATLARAFVHPGGTLAAAMGSMQPLADGGAFVGWGTEPSFSEFAPDGSLRLDARFVGGGSSYRALRLPWTGRPETLPTLVVGAGIDGTRRAYTSWNGATAVTRWRLVAGPAEHTLRPIATVARAGFETAIPFTARSGWIAVEALDAQERTLAASPPRRI